MKGLALTDHKRLQGKIDKQSEIEARWLQKMLFAMSKAREARDKLVETTGESLGPLVTLDDGNQVSLGDLEKLVGQRIDHLMDSLGQGVYGRRG